MFGMVFNVATAYGAKPYRYPLLLVSLILFPASADPCYEDFVEQLRIEKCTIHLTGSDQGVEHGMTKYRKGPQRTAKDHKGPTKDRKGALHRTTEDRQS